MNKKLFIFGNGFDLHHNDISNGYYLETGYKDFRDFLITKYCSDYQESENYTVLEDNIRIPLDEYCTKEEIAEYIIKIIDYAALLTYKEDDISYDLKSWKYFEEYLGSDSFYNIILSSFENEIGWDLSGGIFELDDAVVSQFTNHESCVSQIVTQAKTFFYEWVNKKLKNIDFSKVKKEKIISDILGENNLYLTFNYTLTLEELYKISPENILHIHGKVGDNCSNIIMGHGNNISSEISSEYTNAEDEFLKYFFNDKIKNSLKKDTTKIINNHRDFFNSLKEITEIYSYGCSFSNIDLPYIKEIYNNLSEESKEKVIWYINSYDYEDKKEELKKCGFKNIKCMNW
jgi:hypothetical protein